MILQDGNIFMYTYDSSLATLLLKGQIWGTELGSRLIDPFQNAEPCYVHFQEDQGYESLLALINYIATEKNDDQIRHLLNATIARFSSFRK